MIYFSPSIGGFYEVGVNCTAQTLPQDAVQITQEERAALLDGNSRGMPITFDAATNKPILK